MNDAKTFIQATLPGRLDATYAAIRNRAPNARLVVLGYPRLFQTNYCGWLAMSTLQADDRSTRPPTCSPRSPPAGRRAAGATFVDTRPSFAGHGVCAADPWIHDVSGVIEAYHPDADGYRYGYLTALTAAIG